MLSGAFAAAGVVFSSADCVAVPDDDAAEEFVQANLSQIQHSIDDSNSSDGQRRRTLASRLSAFIAFGPLSSFVLGRYAGAMRANAPLQAQWESTFRDYAIANYEIRLERFRGRTHRVIGSTVRRPGEDVVVFSEVLGGADREPIRLGWRVLRRDTRWQVFDLSVRLQTNEVWLAQQQQAEFLSVLDRNDGDLSALVARVRATTERMRTQPQ